MEIFVKMNDTQPCDKEFIVAFTQNANCSCCKDFFIIFKTSQAQLNVSSICNKTAQHSANSTSVNDNKTSQKLGSYASIEASTIHENMVSLLW